MLLPKPLNIREPIVDKEDVGTRAHTETAVGRWTYHPRYISCHVLPSLYGWNAMYIGWILTAATLLCTIMHCTGYLRVRIPQYRHATTTEGRMGSGAWLDRTPDNKDIRLGVLRPWAVCDGKVKCVKNSAHLAWRVFNRLACRIYPRSMWSVYMTKAWRALSSQWCHSSNAAFTANSLQMSLMHCVQGFYVYAGPEQYRVLSGS